MTTYKLTALIHWKYDCDRPSAKASKPNITIQSLCGDRPPRLLLSISCK
ncbi:MAG: hypothetical protein AAF889_00695 [Cyanobacteria bacterium P01_D01_bin.73]